AFIASLPLAMLDAGRGDAEIGAIMGTAALMQIVAAFVSGGLIDRFGGRVVFLGGSLAFLAGAVALALGLAEPGGALAPLVAVRLLQGIGIAACLPAAMTLVPALVSGPRLGAALAFVGMAANISLAASPPLSLWLLDAGSIRLVAAVTVVSVLAGIGLIGTFRLVEEQLVARATGGRTFRPAWRSTWAAPLAIALLFVGHWGVVTGYLPQRAEAAGADVGLFFTADAVALLLLRVPGGYLAGRVGSRWLVVGGISVTLASLTLLFLPPTTPLLILSGLGTGAGGALVLPPLALDLTNRSDAADRGSAFALYSVAFSLAIALGSLGAAPLVALFGFEPALLIGVVACGLAALVALLERPPARRHDPAAGSLGRPAEVGPA
ncbi:MAG TPA: MFS transporter, partial [Candidatus Limnocylindrales bacterium]|nr:MFS transporter [Candidatus Limnocylindrales bacterium]